MDIYIVIAYALNALIIVTSVLGFLLAKTFVPEVKELLEKNIDKNKKMWFLVIALPVIYEILSIASRSFRIQSGVTFDPFFMVVLFWIIGMYIGTKLILGSDIEENKISLGKFVTIYTIATIVFTVISSFVSALIFATNGY